MSLKIKKLMEELKTIRVPYQGKGYKVQYKVETIDISMTPVGFLNVYAIFVDDPELQPIIGNHFTILYNQMQVIKPAFDIRTPGNVEEMNLKKTIAQQVINNPSE
jgi:hypothetical protein